MKAWPTSTARAWTWRYALHSGAPAGTAAERLFDEWLTPVVSPALLAQSRRGAAPPLATAADLSRHALLEEEDDRPSAAYLGWRRWLTHHGQADLEPQRWTFLNDTHQQVQAALAGQGVALARMALVHEQLASGELLEPFGPAGRLASPAGYWLLPAPGARLTPALQACLAWLRDEAARTRQALPAAPE